MSTHATEGTLVNRSSRHRVLEALFGGVCPNRFYLLGCDLAEFLLESAEIDKGSALGLTRIDRLAGGNPFVGDELEPSFLASLDRAEDTLDFDFVNGTSHTSAIQRDLAPG